MELSQAIADVKRFSQMGFSQEITFTKSDNSASVVVRGLVSKHNNAIDPNTGLPVNERNIHLSVHEEVLKDANYPTRDSNDDINLKDDMAEWVDASGTSYKYLIDEAKPSMTLGLIVCILGDYNG